MSEEEDIWYSVEPVMSRGAMLNYLIGARGCGKTFGFKKKMLECEGQFIWLRRYKPEITKLKPTFFADLAKEGQLPEGDWKVKGNAIMNGKEVKGWFVALSTSDSEKSVSFAGVRFIVFDECLIGEGMHHYLKNEVEMLLEFIETVNRMRGAIGEKEVMVFCISNKTSFVNPHFAYWHILPFEGRWKWAPGKKGLVLVENYKNRAFSDAKRKTKMGRLVDGTDYGAYLIDNEAWFDDDAFISTKIPVGAKAIHNLKYHGDVYGVWWTQGIGIHISRKYDPQVKTWAVEEDHEEGMNLIARRGVANQIMEYYTIGACTFEDAEIKGMAVDIMQRYAGLKR